MIGSKQTSLLHDILPYAMRVGLVQQIKTTLDSTSVYGLGISIVHQIALKQVQVQL